LVQGLFDCGARGCDARDDPAGHHNGLIRSLLAAVNIQNMAGTDEDAARGRRFTGAGDGDGALEQKR
jgi:hypothetical protein